MAPGFSAINDYFDQIIIDQWGVLHDGKIPYTGSLDALTRIKGEGKTVIMLSNSSKRKSASYKGLNKVGFKSDLFDDIVTSGELAFEYISNRRFDFLKSIVGTAKVCVIGNGEDDEEYIEECKCEITPPEQAHFILARGMFELNDGDGKSTKFDNPSQLLNCISPWLLRCIKSSIPMIVSNPDLNRPGSNAPMPGRIGAIYTSMGGRVEYIGKPYAAVYSKCYESFEKLDGKISRICGIGDSLEHDILGAKNNGIISVFTSNGVHCGELGTIEGDKTAPEISKLNALIETCGIMPVYVIPNFSW